MLVFFSIPVLWEHICILNVRLGGELISNTSSCIRPIAKNCKNAEPRPKLFVSRLPEFNKDVFRKVNKFKLGPPKEVLKAKAHPLRKILQ